MEISFRIGYLCFEIKNGYCKKLCNFLPIQRKLLKTLQSCTDRIQRTHVFCFDRLLSGNFYLTNKPRGQSELQVNDDELQAIVEADSSRLSTDVMALHRIVRNSSELTTRFEICTVLNNRHKDREVLDGTITCN